ncbi:unnamed protein product [Closterium sp. NIES-53]
MAQPTSPCSAERPFHPDTRSRQEFVADEPSVRSGLSHIAKEPPDESLTTGAPFPLATLLNDFRGKCDLGLRSLRVADSAFKHLFFYENNGVTVRGVTTLSPEESPNTDSLHLSYVKDALIENCEFSGGDDFERQKLVP